MQVTPEKYATLSTEVVSQNPYWQYVLDSYVLPTGNASPYHYIATHGSTLVVPRLADDTIVMVKQYRYLHKRDSWEFPGGGLRASSTHLQNAHEELIQEAGYKAGKFTNIGQFNPCNGLLQEICQVFLAEQLVQTKNCPEESEEFEIGIFTVLDVHRMIKSNTIWDGMSLAAWSLFIIHHNVRF